ncbi:hypothetical protein E4O05_00355 [Treponema sp. OMZ 787]|uniref:hypothetical protein n=1 Tax=Treponema sp. OMZ 787 TaxID=2563669 RepID=UPI0020A2DD3E|nr:hypothetical protein [Treponema sp. OMZ 787]UTC62409.1 hypothetical protein E4O05_00355 [Treponema sp. OMZ 787]
MEVTKEEMLSLAIRCIGNQETGRCKNGNCKQCPYNIRLYTDNERVALSLMARAKMIWPKTQEAQDRSSLRLLAIVFIAIVMWLFGGWLFGDELSIDRGEQMEWAYKNDEAYRYMASPLGRSFWLPFYYDTARKLNDGTLPEVIGVLGKVQENLRDVNDDGKINCIDYAVVFHEWMPNSYILHMKSGKINHLFVGCMIWPINKVDLYWFRLLDWVEPQAVSMNYNANDLWRNHKDWNELRVTEGKQWYKYATNKQWYWTDKNRTGWRWKK